MHARLSYLHIAPRKVRLVARVIKGMDVARAELELRNLPKRSSGPIGKLLKSAIQNAVHDLNQDASRLYVKEVIVDGGPVMKRQMPRAFGRAAIIRKRMSHVSLTLGLRGGDNTVTGKKRGKASSGEVREADWKEVKGEAKEIRSGIRPVVSKEKGAKKKSGRFAKKMFTRKVI